MNQNSAPQHSKHGPDVTPATLKRTLTTLFTQNHKLRLRGLRSLPVCVWGRNGVGKTETIMALAAERGYDLVYISLAQIEDMGDLLGLPETFNPTPDVPHNPLITTVYRQPEWIAKILRQEDPTRPGILLLDDFNRADRRVQQGVLQLLQLGRLLSWQLPAHWEVVLTANPDDGSYHVTPLDSATHTRMTHLTLVFDPSDWATWARGVGLKEPLVQFVLRYPDALLRPHTTARTLSALLLQVNELSSYTDEDVLCFIRVVGEGCVDKVTVDELIMHLMSDDLEGVYATDLLNAPTVAEALQLLSAYTSLHGAPLPERVAQLSRELKRHIFDPSYTPTPLHKRNLIALLKSSHITPQERLSLHSELSGSSSPLIRDLVNDAALALLILKGA